MDFTNDILRYSFGHEVWKIFQRVDRSSKNLLFMLQHDCGGFTKEIPVGKCPSGGIRKGKRFN